MPQQRTYKRTIPLCSKLEFETWYLENGTGGSIPITDLKILSTMPPPTPLEPLFVNNIGFEFPTSWSPFSFQ